MPKEIERKFLVARDDWRREFNVVKRFQQAVIISEGNRTLRIRIIDDKDGKHARLTLKLGIDGSTMSRHEFEYEIPLAEGEELMALANGKKISKTRYEVPRGDHVWEIDVYDGNLDGLIVAEVEMKTEDASPEMPSWLGRELTGDRRFSNQALAEGSLGDNWRDGLQD
jgi:CYTH domain-containing protein